MAVTVTRVMGLLLIWAGAAHVNWSGESTVLGGFVGSGGIAALAGVEFVLGAGLILAPHHPVALGVGGAFMLGGVVWRVTAGGACDCLPRYLAWLEVGRGLPLRLVALAAFGWTLARERPLRNGIGFSAACGAGALVVVLATSRGNEESCLKVQGSVTGDRGKSWTVTNRCNEPVGGIRVTASCDCSDISFDKHTLQVGETATIAVTWRDQHERDALAMIEWVTSGTRRMSLLR